jgi:hypothetical protein
MNCTFRFSVGPHFFCSTSRKLRHPLKVSFTYLLALVCQLPYCSCRTTSNDRSCIHVRQSITLVWREKVDFLFAVQLRAGGRGGRGTTHEQKIKDADVLERASRVHVWVKHGKQIALFDVLSSAWQCWVMFLRCMAGTDGFPF